MSYSAEKCRQAHLDAMIALWHECIRDTQPGYEGDKERIAQLYHSIGWGWEVEDGYDESAGHEWCGVGIASAGLRIGDHLEADECVDYCLKPEVADYVLPSTGRLYSHRLPRENEWEAAGVPPADEVTNPEAIEPGDILTIYPDRKRWGSHIAMAASTPRNGHVPTIECNSTGRLPNGTSGEGCVRKMRKLDQIAIVYRLFDPHFVALEE